jgi:hypothetical protein
MFILANKLGESSPLRRGRLQNRGYIRYNVVRVIAQSRDPVVPHAGDPGGCRRGAKTAPPPPTTGCATPPGGVGVKRRREMPPTRLLSLRFGLTPQNVGKIPRFWPVRPDRDRFGVTEGESGAFLCVASLPHHLGGWRTRWLGEGGRSWPSGGPPAAPPGSAVDPRAGAPWGHVTKL